MTFFHVWYPPFFGLRFGGGLVLLCKKNSPGINRGNRVQNDNVHVDIINLYSNEMDIKMSIRMHFYVSDNAAPEGALFQV